MVGKVGIAVRDCKDQGLKGKDSVTCGPYTGFRFLLDLALDYQARASHMIATFFLASIKVGVPVAVASYLLVWWAMKKQYFGQVDNLKMLESKVKGLRSAKSQNKKNKSKKSENSNSEDAEQAPEMNPFHNKWLSFGGGFYGVVGLLTYAVVELGEIRDFFSNFDGLISLITDITPDLFIGFIINSIMNFVAAIAWPWYWMDKIHTDHIWIWFIVAYIGYWAGSRYALHQAEQNKS